MLERKKILLGITGSIAAYKAALLARELQRRGAEVRVVMTPSSIEFITPLTLATLTGHPVYSDFTENRDSGEWTNHVELGLWGDAFLIAPATAQTLSAMVTGACDNFLMAVHLSSRCPVIAAPAMDLDMYQHAATQANLEALENRGVSIIQPDSGALASGLDGKGRMAEPEAIANWLENWFQTKAPLNDKKIVITAGPTHEPIDSVRFLGNRSSGKMGFALARELQSAGADVHLIAGPVQLNDPSGVQVTRVETALEMHAEAMKAIKSADIGIATAAVSDFRAKTTSKVKWHRNEMPTAIELDENPDILYDWGKQKRDGQILVGFALETDNGIESAKSKLKRKNLNFIVLNSTADPGAGFGTDTNKISIFEQNGKSHTFDLKSKDAVAHDITQLILTHLPQ